MKTSINRLALVVTMIIALVFGQTVAYFTDLGVTFCMVGGVGIGIIEGRNKGVTAGVVFGAVFILSVVLGFALGSYFK